MAAVVLAWGATGCDSQPGPTAKTPPTRAVDTDTAAFASWLQRAPWECVNATIPLMKGATFTFGDGTLNLRGGDVSLTRTFRVVSRDRMDGREFYNVRVDNDDLIILTSAESVPGTDHFSMTWGSDGSAQLGLGRRSR
jgi:hypothetical protein